MWQDLRTNQKLLGGGMFNPMNGDFILRKTHDIFYWIWIFQSCFSHTYFNDVGSNTNQQQGGHVLANMKFPVFSLCFPCVAEIFPVFFYWRTNSNSNKRNVTCSKLYYLFFIKTIHSLTKKSWIINRFFYHVFICIININSLFLFNMKALSTVYLLLH